MADFEIERPSVDVQAISPTYNVNTPSFTIEINGSTVGQRGEKGEKGDKGDPGEPGAPNILTIGTVVSGDTANASITGTTPNQVLNLVLPQGEPGQDGQDGINGVDGQDGRDGEDGVGIQSVVQTTTSTEDDGNNIVTVTLTDGTTSTFTVQNGSKGSTGVQGPAGADGEDGAKGDKGDKGDTGVGVESIEQTTTSHESGGTNIITATLTDGTTSEFYIKNGEAGGGGGGGTSDYNDLTNKPSINNVTLTGNKTTSDLGINIPTSTSELTNDSGFITSSSLPTKVSDLTNDAEFITNTVNNLTNYYTKANTYTKTEVDNLISAVSTMDIQVVQTLPTQDISTTTIYLVPKTASTNDAYDEYIYVNNNWEHIGSTEVDLSNYYTKTETDNLLNSKADISDIPEVGNSKNYYGTSSTPAATQTKVVLCEGFTLETGNTIDVKFTNAQTYNGAPKLNINSTGEISVQYKGGTNGIRYMWSAGEVIRFVYDGTYYVCIGRALASTTYYGITKLSSAINSTSTSLAATPSAVKQAYDLANSKQDEITSTNKLDYSLISNTPTIPTVNNATLTIQKNGTTVKTFTANASSNVTANITVPTQTSELTNNSGYITKSVSDLTNYTPTSSLATVATSGSYNDLTNKPTIPTVPTNVSAFTNDSGYINEVTSSDVYNALGYYPAAEANIYQLSRIRQITSASDETYLSLKNDVTYNKPIKIQGNLTIYNALGAYSSASGLTIFLWFNDYNNSCTKIALISDGTDVETTIDTMEIPEISLSTTTWVDNLF